MKRYLLFTLEGGHIVKDELSEPEFAGKSDAAILEASRKALNLLSALGKPYTIVNGEVINVHGVQSLTIETVGGGH